MNITDQMIDKVLEAEYQLGNGNPLKDFMDGGEIEILVYLVAGYLRANGYDYQPDSEE